MKHRLIVILISCLAVFFIISMSPVPAEHQTVRQIIKNKAAEQQPNTGQLKFAPSLSNTPLYFIPNRGQVHEDTLFYARTPNYTLWVTPEGKPLQKNQEAAGNL